MFTSVHLFSTLHILHTDFIIKKYHYVASPNHDYTHINNQFIYTSDTHSLKSNSAIK